MAVECAGRVYRLLVELDDEQVVYDAPPFRTFKEARAQIAGAVRRHAQDGAVHGIILQAGRPLSDRQAFPPSVNSVRACALRWHTLDRWGSVVIDRILEQSNPAARTAADTNTAAPPPHPVDVAPASPPAPAPGPIAALTESSADEDIAKAPAPSPPIAAPPEPPQSAPAAPPKKAGQHRPTTWQLPLTMIFLLATWASFAALVMGGNLFDLLLASGDDTPRGVAVRPFVPDNPGFDGNLPPLTTLQSLTDGLTPKGR